MTEQLKKSGALSSSSNGGSKSVAAGLSILLAFLFPENMQVIAAGALTAVIDYLLPSKLPWKK